MNLINIFCSFPNSSIIQQFTLNAIIINLFQVQRKLIVNVKSNIIKVLPTDDPPQDFFDFFQILSKNFFKYSQSEGGIFINHAYSSLPSSRAIYLLSESLFYLFSAWNYLSKIYIIIILFWMIFIKPNNPKRKIFFVTICIKTFFNHQQYNLLIVWQYKMFFFYFGYYFSSKSTHLGIGFSSSPLSMLSSFIL